MNALIAVDVQNDFCPGGALAVPDGDQVVPVINKLMTEFDNVIITQDWHPDGHLSFASSHPDKEPFDEIRLSYGPQVLWPDHCIQGSAGAEFQPELDYSRTQLIIRKGFRKEIDSYSAFFENDHQTPTGLAGYLRDRGIQTLYITGLAADFCVKWTVLDACKAHFKVHVVEDAVRGLNVDGSLARAWNEMETAGAAKIHSTSIVD